MKCRKCGAVLLDTDTFCVKCGQRVDQPMLCSSCGEQLRDGERFCHKCGSPVEFAMAEDDEIPLSQQRTVDIPFDEIEQGILMEAEQAIVKRPGTGKPERRNAEGYSRPGTADAESYRQTPLKSGEHYRQLLVREPEYYEDIEEDDDEEYEVPVRQKRRTPPPPRYEEEYDDYEEDDDDEDSGDSRMKLVTIILGIVVVAIALVIGFIFWQRNDTSRYERPEEETEAGEEAGEENSDGESNEASGDTEGRIQILSNVNVRNKPTTEGSEVLMVAKAGETYEYYELVDGAWYHIKLEAGKDGYVSKKYVEELN